MKGLQIAFQVESFNREIELNIDFFALDLIWIQICLEVGVRMLQKLG